jgi:hypothetical protein
LPGADGPARILDWPGAAPAMLDFLGLLEYLRNLIISQSLTVYIIKVRKPGNLALRDFFCRGIGHLDISFARGI